MADLRINLTETDYTEGFFNLGNFEDIIQGNFLENFGSYVKAKNITEIWVRTLERTSILDQIIMFCHYNEIEISIIIPEGIHTGVFDTIQFSGYTEVISEDFFNFLENTPEAQKYCLITGCSYKFLVNVNNSLVWKTLKANVYEDFDNFLATKFQEYIESKHHRTLLESSQIKEQNTSSTLIEVPSNDVLWQRGIENGILNFRYLFDSRKVLDALDLEDLL